MLFTIIIFAPIRLIYEKKHINACVINNYLVSLPQKISFDDNTDIIHHRCVFRAADNRIRIRNFHNDRTAIPVALLRRGHHPVRTACLCDIVDNNGEVQASDCMEKTPAHIGCFPYDEFPRHTGIVMAEGRHPEIYSWHNAHIFCHLFQFLC